MADLENKTSWSFIAVAHAFPTSAWSIQLSLQRRTTHIHLDAGDPAMVWYSDFTTEFTVATKIDVYT
jgi:hypothetical protein